jgi:hypothetical protein
LRDSLVPRNFLLLNESDYPFSLGDMPGILGRVNQLSPSDRDAVRSGNAIKLFGL